MMEKPADSATTHTSASNGSGSPDGGTGGSRRLSAYLQSVAQISGIVTIIGATVYALGLFTLVLPISSTYDPTFPAAWYAVSVVPKTVVVGYGIKSLVWPSLALTLATTFFALVMLWVLHTSAIGWRHARAAAERPALSLFAMANIYTFLSVLAVIFLFTVPVALFAWEAFWSGKSSIPGIGSYVVSQADNLLRVQLIYLSLYLAAGLCVLSCSAAAGSVVVRSLRGASRLIKSRTFPSMSFRGFIRGFIYKGLVFAVLSSVFLFMLWLLMDILSFYTASVFLEAFAGPLLLGCLFSLVLAWSLGLAAALSLMLRLLRYTRKTRFDFFIYKGLGFAVLSSVILFLLFLFVRTSSALPLPKTREALGLQALGDNLGWGLLLSLSIAGLFGLAVALSSLPAPLRDLRASLGQRVSGLSDDVLYSMVLFWVLYLALFVAVNTLPVLRFLIGTGGEITSGTWSDEFFVPLVVFSVLVSGVIMYRKDWKDLGGYEGNLVARGSWRPFLIGLLKSIGARSLRRGLLLSLVVAYVIALALAFLLAELRPPPLPKVEVNNLTQAESAQPGQESDFQGKTLALLAHTEGHWYLIDEAEGHLLVVPDQTDKFIRLRLDERPK
jgi:hypothetical protein